MKRAFIIAAFGDRRMQVQRLIKNIRSYVDYPIYIITTKDSDIGIPVGIGTIYGQPIHIKFVERLWPNHPRSGQRNGDYYPVFYALNLNYNSFCLLDDDMFIVNKNFVEGFDIAERFGIALPLNPRIYVKYDAMGADVQQKDLEEIKDWPQYAPACNFSPFFVCPRITNANVFLKKLKEELRFNYCRGPLAIWKVSMQTGFSPVYLPEQYCVCGDNAEYIKNYTMLLKGQQVKIPIMMLHLGHEKVKEVFKGIIK